MIQKDKTRVDIYGERFLHSRESVNAWVKSCRKLH